MRYLLLLLLPLLFTNCGKDETILFQMKYNEEFEIPAGLNTFETHHFLIRNITTNYDNLLNTFGREDSEVTTIKPQNARLDAIFSSAEYDIIREISIRVYKDNPSNFQEIFYMDNVPLNTDGDLNLIPTLVEVQDKLTSESFNVDVAIQFRQTPTQFIESRLTLEFAVQ